MSGRGLLAAATLLGALLVPVGRTATARPLTLQQAIELAFAESAEVLAARLEVRRREGGELRLEGPFDPRLRLGLDVAYQRLSLIGAQVGVTRLASESAITGDTSPLGDRLPLGDKLPLGDRSPLGDKSPLGGDSPVRVASASSTLPEDQDAFELRIAGAWPRLLPSGILLAPRAELAVFDEDFVLAAISDLSLDLPTLFRSTLAVDLDLPLRRGRGELEVTAELGVQRLELAGDEAQLEHQAARTALGVADAYWQAAAGAERLMLLERARDLEREILRLGEGLVAADQIPRAALAVSRARVARVEAAAAAARAELQRLRVAIADAAGLELRTGGDLPLPVDQLPQVPERLGVPGDAGQAIARAIAGRADVVELVWRQQAAELRADARRLAARRRLDLSLSFGWQGFAEGGGWTRGLLDALRGELGGPLASFAVELELPAGNRSLRGEELRARSLAAGVAIDRQERERRIRNRVVALLERLSSSVREAADRSQTARHYRTAVEAEISRLAFGDSTVIDLVATEELLTGAELAELDARVDYARTLAELQFELGALVDVEVSAGGVRLAALSAQRLAL